MNVPHCSRAPSMLDFLSDCGSRPGTRGVSCRLMASHRIPITSRATAERLTGAAPKPLTQQPGGRHLQSPRCDAAGQHQGAPHRRRQQGHGLAGSFRSASAGEGGRGNPSEGNTVDIVALYRFEGKQSMARSSPLPAAMGRGIRAAHRDGQRRAAAAHREPQRHAVAALREQQRLEQLRTRAPQIAGKMSDVVQALGVKALSG